jgi:hypothetical protein
VNYDRLIRAELYQSERWLSLPTDTHRLIYNALIHTADDFGNIEGGSRRLWRWMSFSQVKSEQDAIKIMSELADVDMVRHYVVDAKEFWHLPRFHNTRTYTTRIHPPSPWCDPLAYTGSYKRTTKQAAKAKSDSDLNQSSFKPDSDLKIGVGVGVGVKPKPSGDFQSPADLCPHQKIIDLYLECMPTNPRVQKSRWSGSESERNLRLRWREGLNSKEGPFCFDNIAGGLAAFRHFFEICAQSDFLCGRAPPDPGRRPFLADLHWLLKRANFDKILSNRYHREAA